MKAHQRATGHTTEDPNNPNLYSTLSVNNPNRIAGKKEKIIDATKIRPVSRKKTATNKKQTFPEQKLEPKLGNSNPSTRLALLTQSSDNTMHLDNVELSALAPGDNPNSNYGLALLPNGTMIMSQLDVPTIFQLSP